MTDVDASKKNASTPIVVSGTRPTGALHLGHLNGALKNWVSLQATSRCYFFVADWHALTTEYANPTGIRDNTHEMILDWLAVGLDPARSVIFRQSEVPEHAELHLLFSMIIPIAWLERVPTYKEQQEQLEGRDLSTYGFLGYPLLQAADILIYKAGAVPVGEDQLPHVELTREVAPATYRSRRSEGLSGLSPARDLLHQPRARRARRRLPERLDRLRGLQEGDDPPRPGRARADSAAPQRARRAPGRDARRAFRWPAKGG